LFEILFERSEITISGVQFRDLPLIKLLLTRKSDEIRSRFTIQWGKRIQPGPDVAELFNLLGQVLHRSSGASDSIRIRVQRPRALRQRHVNRAHLLATKFVQQGAAFIAEDFIRYLLDLETAVDIQRQKRAAIQINSIDGPSVRREKNRILLKASLDCVAVRTFGETRDRDKSPTCQIRLNKVRTVLRGSWNAAERNLTASASVDFPLPRAPMMQVRPRGTLTVRPGRNPPLISIFSIAHMCSNLLYTRMCFSPGVNRKIGPCKVRRW
jgi:hypothetical protein